MKCTTIENILNGIVKDETVFGIIYTLDDDDDWTDEDVWIKRTLRSVKQ